MASDQSSCCGSSECAGIHRQGQWEHHARGDTEGREEWWPNQRGRHERLVHRKYLEEKNSETICHLVRVVLLPNLIRGRGRMVGASSPRVKLILVGW